MKETWPYYYGFGKTKKVEFVLELLSLNLVITKDSRSYKAVIYVSPGVVSFADENNLSAEELSLLISSPAANLVFRTIQKRDTYYCPENGPRQYAVDLTFIEK